jgi:hypothetical protein
MPSLLLRLGASSSLPVRAVAGGVTAASPHRWGMNIGVDPVGGGHRLRWPRERDAVSGGRTLCLLLESDAKEPFHLVQPLVGLRVWHVIDVFQAAGGDCHVVRRIGEAKATRSPRTGVVVAVERVHGLLLRKVPPLALSGLQVHLLSSQVVRLPLKVGCAAMGTLVWWREPRAHPQAEPHRQCGCTCVEGCCS